MRMLHFGMTMVIPVLVLLGCGQKSGKVLDEITGSDGLIRAELFLDGDTAVSFWSIREVPGRGTLMVQEGVLGGETRSFEVYEKGHELLVSKAVELTSEKQRLGYKSYGPEAYTHLIVQVDTLAWGSIGDVDKLALVEDLFNVALVSSGNGKCTGSDIADKVNFFAVVFDAGIAVKTILRAIREEGLELPVVIAVEKGSDIQVLWPENFQGEFSLI